MLSAAFLRAHEGLQHLILNENNEPRIQEPFSKERDNDGELLPARASDNRNRS
jgi:hypothetical protein